MSRQQLSLGIAGVAVVIVAGLGLGFGVARFWRADASLPAREPAAPDVSRLAQEPAERPGPQSPIPPRRGRPSPGAHCWSA